MKTTHTIFIFFILFVIYIMHNSRILKSCSPAYIQYIRHGCGRPWLNGPFVESRAECDFNGFQNQDQLVLTNSTGNISQVCTQIILVCPIFLCTHAHCASEKALLRKFCYMMPFMWLCCDYTHQHQRTYYVLSVLKYSIFYIVYP